MIVAPATASRHTERQTLHSGRSAGDGRFRSDSAGPIEVTTILGTEMLERCGAGNGLLDHITCASVRMNWGLYRLLDRSGSFLVVAFVILCYKNMYGTITPARPDRPECRQTGARCA